MPAGAPPCGQEEELLLLGDELALELPLVEAEPDSGFGAAGFDEDERESVR